MNEKETYKIYSLNNSNSFGFVGLKSNLGGCRGPWCDFQKLYYCDARNLSLSFQFLSFLHQYVYTKYYKMQILFHGRSYFGQCCSSYGWQHGSCYGEWHHQWWVLFSTWKTNLHKSSTIQTITYYALSSNIYLFPLKTFKSK